MPKGHYDRSVEHCNKLSEVMKRRWQAPNWRDERIKQIRKLARDPLYREKVSKGLRGKPKTEKHREKLSVASKIYFKTHKPWNWGGGKPYCKICGKKLKNYGSKKCKNCYMKLMGGKNNPNYGNHKIAGKNHPMYGKISHHGKGQRYKNIYMRSSWELIFAKWLDESNICWEYEPKAFPVCYTYNGQFKQGTYRPDFYLPKLNLWIEVKGWWRDDALFKFNAFLSQYADLKVKLITIKNFDKSNWMKIIEGGK